MGPFFSSSSRNTHIVMEICLKHHSIKMLPVKIRSNSLRRYIVSFMRSKFIALKVTTEYIINIHFGMPSRTSISQNA